MKLRHSVAVGLAASAALLASSVPALATEKSPTHGPAALGEPIVADDARARL